MTEKDAELALADMLDNLGYSADLGYGEIRVTNVEAFGSRMLTLNRGITLELECDEETVDEDDTVRMKTNRYKFQLVIHAA